MTPTEAAIAEFKRTILDLSDRLANSAALIADLQAKNEELLKSTQRQDEPKQ